VRFNYTIYTEVQKLLSGNSWPNIGEQLKCTERPRFSINVLYGNSDMCITRIPRMFRETLPKIQDSFISAGFNSKFLSASLLWQGRELDHYVSMKMETRECFGYTVARAINRARE